MRIYGGHRPHRHQIAPGIRLSQSVGTAMNKAKKSRERWMALAEMASKEQDPKKLIALVKEINELLGENELPSNTALPPTGTSR
jgi:hypothetical protein